jgi:hypothetical protein
MIEWLAFLHPVWQSVGIALGFVALREGLRMRRRRREQVSTAIPSAQRWRHIRLGQCSMWFIASGYLLGMGELWFNRGEPVLRSGHFYLATVALGLFCWGVLYGFAMLRNSAAYAEQRDLHGFLLPLALVLLVGAGFFGLRLLP